MKTGLYRHYEFGKVYRVVGFASLWPNDGSFVLFHEEGDPTKVFVTGEDEFLGETEHLGSTARRFAFLEPVTKEIKGRIQP